MKTQDIYQSMLKKRLGEIERKLAKRDKKKKIAAEQ